MRQDQDPRPARRVLALLAAMLAAACQAAPGAPGSAVASPASPATAASPPVAPSGTAASNAASRTFESHTMRLECRGDRPPTVVLEYGLGGGASGAWAGMRSSISPFSRVCTYERIDAGELPPPPVDIAANLHALLHDAGAPPPYVMVGHSWGAIYVRVFTLEFPDDVVGLVLVDPSHPDQHARWLEAMGPAKAGEPEAVARARDELEMVRDDPHFALSREQVRRATSVGERPLVVVTAAFEVPPDLPADVQSSMRDDWLAMHEELAALSTNHVHVLAARSGHNIPLDQPRLVVEAIRQVAEAARTATVLEPCGVRFEEVGGECLS